ncbi:HvfC/BufC N-terminal domain-containing protein [Labilibacter marinus]|uniref:HvfC/BufC N-terminal domain-containing protein n=1 Tax=Labilibacter marinus TaxID=1477105 RepID=UPI0008350015|nr:putative DNA-binding domain-containing protein [Labilibacter marinus]
MYLNKSTIDIQTQLASYCRTGQEQEIEKVSQERVKHYRRLVFSNVKNTLETAYPITLEWLSDDEWLKLVNDFFEMHDAQSPKIWELPKEFMEFVTQNKYAATFNKPALNNLLLVEWVEIEVHTMMDKEWPAVEARGEVLLLTPEYQLLHLDYPVHIFNGDDAQDKKGDWFIYIFRNRETDGVQFLNISALHVFVLEKLYETPLTLDDLLPIISAVFGLNDMKTLQNHLKTFFSDLRKKGALLSKIA